MKALADELFMTCESEVALDEGDYLLGLIFLFVYSLNEDHQCHRQRSECLVRRPLFSAWGSADLGSNLLPFRQRIQGDGGLAGEQEESKRFLQIQADSGVGMAEITDGNILPDVQFEITATSS